MTNLLNVQPVVLCGGSGTRLWPLSRAGFPKQFLCLTGQESLFQQSVKRLMDLGTMEVRVANPLIVTGEEHRFLVSEQLRDSGIELGAVLLEPVGRNTAPALTLAALAALESGTDPILVVTPSDQTVANAIAFTKALHTAIFNAAKGDIVILGITPDRPETAFGYIQAKSSSDRAMKEVVRFVEKPDSATAQSYLDQGGYYWNAGIFVLKASTWLSAIKTFRKDISDATATAWVKRSADSKAVIAFIRPGKDEFSAVPAESIDYAVMEKCCGGEFSIKMIPLDAGWSDLGAWDAVWNVLPKDELGNANIGDVLTTDSHNNLVHSSGRLVTLVGVHDLIVIETVDAVLVAGSNRSQDVKHIVAKLQIANREEHTLHRKVHRPWGWYDSIDVGERFKVKRIQVKSGASLSLQKHRHRAEHWVVVKGLAKVTCGETVTILYENQSTYIPIGIKHRLENPANTPLEIIEIQSGEYLAEDDIIRFEDNYGRS
jgi:mannose-1-phosphate guanylyltransferase/mannose-6-phosphate isomerase